MDDRGHSPSLLPFILALVLATRISVLLVGWFAVNTIGFPGRPPLHISNDVLLNLPARWDAGWYLQIARIGFRDHHSGGQENIAFFPVAPMLMRSAAEILARTARVTNPDWLEGGDVRVLWGGVVISIAAFAWAMLYLYRLARMDLGDEEARAALVFLAAYPFAIFYSAPFTEALFLLGTAATLYFFRLRRPWPAAAWGLMVGLTRPNGCLLSVVLGLMWLGYLSPAVARWLYPPRDNSPARRDELLRLGAAAAMPGIGMLLYSAFVYNLTGDAFKWISAQAAWHRGNIAVPLVHEVGLVRDLGLYVYAVSHPFNLVNTAGAVFALALLIPVTRRFGLVYGAFMALNILPHLATGLIAAAGRYTSVLFPMFFYLATVVPPPRRVLMVSVLALLQGFAAAMFFTWRPLYDVSTPVRAWVRALDVVTVVSLLAAALVEINDGLHVLTPWGYWRASTGTRALVFGAVCLIVRHALCRSPALPTRLVRSVPALWHSRAFRQAWPVALTTRLAILAIGLMAAIAVAAPDDRFHLSTNRVWDMHARWDAVWYSDIAENGYRWNGEVGDEQPVAFFPAFPFLMRAGADLLEVPVRLLNLPDLLGGRRSRLILTGVLISLAAFCGALAYLYSLTREELGEDVAQAAVVLLASYPYAVYFGAAYTESLFLLATLGAFYHLRRCQWVKAGAWGLLTGLTRPNGALVSIPLALLACGIAMRRRGEPRGPRPLVPLLAGLTAAAMPGLGLLIFAEFIRHLTGNWLAWADAQRGWGLEYRGPLTWFSHRVALVGDIGFWTYVSHFPLDAFSTCAVLFALAMIWPATRRLGVAYGVLIAVSLIPPLGIDLPAIGRMTAVLFPVFIALASLIPSAYLPVAVPIFALGQGLVAVLFYSWRPPW